MLYIISTPIGNLKDISLRAIEVLENLDILLCEDTRHTGMLLKKLGIKNNPKLVSYYMETEEQKIPEIMEYLKKGLEVGLVSDAGTPLLSDPGWLLVKRCQKENINYTAVPGASALINGLVLSGLPMGRFCYLGFLPKKDGDRKKILSKYKEIEGTKVVYESPFRLVKLISEIKEIFGEKVEIRICREMTKKFEEVLSPEKLSGEKGEAVVVFY
jgi:16S rRNA (cytidine1402-2'-O)-methyltransferase